MTRKRKQEKHHHRVYHKNFQFTHWKCQKFVEILWKFVLLNTLWCACTSFSKKYRKLVKNMLHIPYPPTQTSISVSTVLLLSQKTKWCYHDNIPNQNFIERFHLKTLKHFHFFLATPFFLCIWTHIYPFMWYSNVTADDDGKMWSECG